MPRDLGWVRIILGAVTMLSLAALLYLLVSLAIDPLLYATIMGGGKLVTSASWELQSLADAFVGLFRVVALLLALMAGSLVASGSNRPYPGLRAAISAGLVVFGVFVYAVVVVVLWLAEPVSGPAEAYTRSENTGLVILWFLVGFIVLPPILLLAGYIGGRFGQPLLRRMADR